MSAQPSRPSPYQGLTPFDERDAAYFFGRERDSRLIAADLFAAPLTVLYGASGVGKSSVLRAGVLPLLRQDQKVLAIIFGAWQTEPLRALRRAVRDAVVAMADGSDRSRLDREMARLETQSLAGYLTGTSKLVQRRLLLILDQFEEYSLYHPEDDDFGREFPSVASAGEIALSVMLSLREEAVSWLDRFEGRIPGLFDNFRRVDHLDRDAGRAAIERPLGRYHEDHPDAQRMSVEPALVDQVLDEVVTGRVQMGEARGGVDTVTQTATVAPSARGRVEAPYLQLVMTRLWDEESRDASPLLRSETFVRLGGAEQIVRDHLKHVMARLTDPEQDIAAHVFQLLVTPSATKIAYSVSDLAATAGVDAVPLADVLEKLASGRDRILRPVAPPPDGPSAPRYEIFHDRLARPILEWRSHYLKDKEVHEVKREQVKRRSEQPMEFRDRRLRDPLHEASAGTRQIPPYAAIADLMRSKGMVVVLGAGVSASVRPEGEKWHSPSPFAPTTWELIQMLAHYSQYPLEQEGTPTLAEVASFCALTASRTVLLDAMRNVVMPVNQPAHLHRLLARVAGTAPLTIVSTTYDTLIEQAFDEAGKPYEVLTNAVAPERMVWRRPSGESVEVDPRELRQEVPWSSAVPMIYKVFGSLSRTDRSLDRFIITEEDEMELFAAWTAGKLPPHRIASALEERPALFVGMGLRSWTQRLLLSRLRRTDRSRRWTDWSIVRNVSEINVARWKAAGVQLCDVDVATFSAGLDEALSRP